MTNHDAISSDLTARIIARADALLSDFDADDYSDKWYIATELLELLDIPTRTEIALQHELCPMHLCDERICADDDISDCAALRA
jgi:hypothetical protein